MPDITAVPDGLSVRYERDHFPDGRIAIDVTFRVATFAGITSDDDATSANRQLERAVRKTQDQVRAIVAKWDAEEPAKHVIETLNAGSSEGYFARCKCGWRSDVHFLSAVEIASQEHLLENGIVR